MSYHTAPYLVRWLTTLTAFATGVVRRRRPFLFYGVYWSFCAHRSHQKGLRCWRWFVYDGYCAKHNNSCYSRCPKEET